MGSISESIDSGRSHVRRYSSIQTRLQRWNNGRSIGDFQPHLQTHVQTHVTRFLLQSPEEKHNNNATATNLKMNPRRTPALDLAQQAQLAACNYLGYSPRELPNPIYLQQGLPSDTPRPLELHMHHHHHHYVGSPTSPFSQTSTQFCEGNGSEVPLTGANELTIRVGSPLLGTATSTATAYPALGLHGSSVGPPYVTHGFQPQARVQNSSQSLLHATSLGEAESTQRYLQNVLWLKNQIDVDLEQSPRYEKERKGETRVGLEGGIIGKESGSPNSGLLHPVASERRTIARPNGHVKKMLWPRHEDEARNFTSEIDDASSMKSEARTAVSGDSALLLDKFEKTRPFRNYNSPYNSPSEDNSVTDDSTPVILAPTKCERSPCVAMNIRTEMIKNGQTNGTTDATSLQMSKALGMARPAGCLTCPAWPRSRGRENRLYRRVNYPCDDTTSSLEDDSVCSSAKLSEQRSTWTYNSSCTENESHQKELSQAGRPAKKSCGARASRRQASREARAWDSIQRRPPKSLNRTSEKLDEKEESVHVYEMDSDIDAKEKAVEDRHSSVPEEKPSVQDRCKEDKVRGDAEMSSVQGPGSQTRGQSEKEIPKKISVIGHAETAWIASVAPKRSLHHVSDEQDKIHKTELRLENLLDEEPGTLLSPKDDVNKAIDHSSHNRLREAVEAAWKTNLGTKRGLEDNKVPSDRQREDLHKNQDISKDQKFREESQARQREDLHKNQDISKDQKFREESQARQRGDFHKNQEISKDQKFREESQARQRGDLHKNQDMSKEQKFREEGHQGELKDDPANTEQMARTYHEACKASLGTKKALSEHLRKEEPPDPVLWDIHRDHENLKALVAREESLQKELKDQTVARVAAEERARVAAEQKAHIYEASAKAAEEGLRVLLDERAVFHSKFTEELEQGATDRLRLQELLHLEKLKLEATEGELREVRRSFQDSLTVGTRALPIKNSLQDPRLDVLPVHAVAPHGIGAGHDEARLQLMAESESRVAAEAKASYFEASAKAAEERLRTLLDERNWFYSRFKEELEHNNTDMIKLQQLMELEKATDGRSDPPQKMKLDVRSLVASSVANGSLDIKTEDDQGTLQNGMHYEASFYSLREEEIGAEDEDMHKLEPLLECAEPREELVQDMEDTKPLAIPYGLRNISETEISAIKEAEGGLEDNWMPVSSSDVNDKRDGKKDRYTSEKSNVKNEKKRPLSPMNNSRVRHWKSPDGPFSMKIERRSGGGGETTTVLDISPGNGGFNSLDLQFGETPPLPKGSQEECQLAGEEMEDIKEDIFDERKSSDLALKTFSESSGIKGGQPMSIPTKWKKETKAELRRMIQEQEMTWKIAEDAVEELGRRLELLEGYKMDIEDTLGRSRAMGNMDCFLTRLEEKLEDFPRGFNSFYNSPIYEERKRGSTALGDPAQEICTSPNRPNMSKDAQIQQLKVEIVQLRDELQRRERKRASSPKMKGDFQFFPRSPPSPILPMPPPQEIPDWPAIFMSGCQAPMTSRDPPPLYHVSEGNPIAPEQVAKEMEPELPDDPFEEMKSVTAEAMTNSRKEYSDWKIVRLQDSGNCSPTGELDIDNRSWVPIPDEGEKSPTPMCTDDANSQTKHMGFNNGYGQEDEYTMSGDPTLDEGDLQVLKTAVQKLSHIFWEQEGKLKDFKGVGNKAGAASSQINLRDLYLELLKEMSQQLGELCRDLQSNSQPHERLVQNRCMEIMDTLDLPAAATQSDDAELAHVPIIEEGNHDLVLIEELESGAKHLLKTVGDQAEDIMSESANLRAALEAAEKNLEEQTKANLLLTEKLESGAQYLSKVIEDHAEEILRKDESISYAQQVNLHLANDMSQTGESLAELRLRYKGLVSNLEYQLESARKEAISLQDTVNELKVETARKDNLVLTLEGETKGQQLQIKELRGQIQAVQDENNAAVREKVDLMNILEATRKEADEQHHRVAELITINEDLIAFSQGKEDEIRALTKTVQSLEQCGNEKSEEVAKRSAEALKFSKEVVEARQEGEIYRLRCAALKSKLQETEEELVAREESMERLVQYLGEQIEGQDHILEEKEQLLLSLNKAQYKEHRMDDQVRQSKLIIQDLEEKLNSMDAEIHDARLEMATMKAKGQESLAIERQAGEMRNRVYQLEEEVMEKEGQISILKTAYPGEYSSTF